MQCYEISINVLTHIHKYWCGTFAVTGLSVGAIKQVTSHYLSRWWLVYWSIYASLGLSELRPTYNMVIKLFFDTALWYATMILGDSAYFLLLIHANLWLRITLGKSYSLHMLLYMECPTVWSIIFGTTNAFLYKCRKHAKSAKGMLHNHSCWCIVFCQRTFSMGIAWMCEVGRLIIICYASYLVPGKSYVIG